MTSITSNMHEMPRKQQRKSWKKTLSKSITLEWNSKRRLNTICRWHKTKTCELLNLKLIKLRVDCDGAVVCVCCVHTHTLYLFLRLGCIAFRNELLCLFRIQHSYSLAFFPLHIALMMSDGSFFLHSIHRKYFAVVFLTKYLYYVLCSFQEHFIACKNYEINFVMICRWSCRAFHYTSNQRQKKERFSVF